MAVVFEGSSLGAPQAKALGGGWQANSGAFAVKKDSIPLLELWLNIFKEEFDALVDTQCAEQQGE
jgi:hypothetical protein